MNEENLIKTEINSNSVSDEKLEAVRGMGEIQGSPNFEGLDKSNLIGDPLKAAIEAQEKLSKTYNDFINKLKIEEEK